MPMPYLGIYQFTAAAEQRGSGVHRSLFLDALDDDAIDTILDAMAAAPSSPMAMIQIRVLGGAVARVAADATAFAHREAPVMVAIITTSRTRPRPVHEAWTTASTRRSPPDSIGVYTNFLEVEGDDRIREAYPDGTLRAAGRRQAPLRPDEPVPPQPEHPPGRLTELTAHRPRTSERPAGREAGGAS